LKDERNEQTSRSTIAIEEWMNRLELHMCKCRVEQCTRRIVAVQELFQSRQTGFDLVGGRRHELRVARPSAAAPVLAATEIARLLRRPAPARQQFTVHFANQPVGQRKPLA